MARKMNENGYVSDGVIVRIVGTDSHRDGMVGVYWAKSDGAGVLVPYFGMVVVENKNIEISTADELIAWLEVGESKSLFA